VVFMEPKQLRVEPGTSASARVRIRNTGSTVDGYRLSVVHDPGRWARIDPPEIQLFPGTEGEATLSFSPPRDPRVRAGTYVFGVQAASTSQPGSIGTEQGQVTVEPFQAVAIEITPRVSRGRRSGHHRLTVRNEGNDVARATVRARDPEERVHLAVLPSEMDIEPGAYETVDIEVAPVRPLRRGSEHRWPFEVETTVPPLARDQLTAVFEQRASGPSWIAAAALLAVALLAGSGLVALATGKNPIEFLTSLITPAGETAGPTIAPTLAPTSIASDVASPSPDIQTPPPTPFISRPPTPPPSPGITSFVSAGGGATYPVVEQEARFQSEGGIDVLIATLTFEVNGDECDVLVVVPDDATVATYNVDLGDVALNLASCPPLPEFLGDDGSITVTHRSVTSISGTFFASQDEDKRSYSGTFENVTIVPR
jgi:hypothetical protein